MRRTSAPLLFGLAVAGGVIGWLLQVGLAASGAPTFIPPLSSYAVLFLVAVAVLLLAWPVRRSIRGARRNRVDPFFAMRVLLLAKTSSIIGGLGLGFGAALVAYTVSRTGTTATPAFSPSLLLGIAALILLVAGLVAESWCRIPPEDTASSPDAAYEAR